MTGELLSLHNDAPRPYTSQMMRMKTVMKSTSTGHLDLMGRLTLATDQRLLHAEGLTAINPETDEPPIL